MNGLIRRARRSERGATAVIFAIMAVLMLSMAAIGVDLGNAMNRKKQTQTSADFAALAGAVGLPSSVPTLPADPANSAIAQSVADYINDNQPATDGTDDCGVAPGSTTAVTMTDLDPTNGEIYFPDSDHIKVVSPPARVQFGLANAMGFDNTCVQSVATAAIKSGSTGMAPYYVTPSCSSGAQVLKSNSGGLSLPVSVPVLKYDTQTNTSVLSGTVTPDQVSLVDPTATPSVAISFSGTNLGAANIDAVGFFNSDQSEPVPATITYQTSTMISVLLPVAVQSRQDVWWIRVHHKVGAPPAASSDQWSARSQALPLLVGDAVLFCDPDSDTGNFGSIDLPWGGNDKDDLTRNIRDGLHPGLTLKSFPGPPYPDLLPPNDCEASPDGVTSSDGDYKQGTNCVQTVTGLEAKPAYSGYLATSGPNSGKLIADTSDLCRNGPQHRPTRYTLAPTNEQINADTLSCFLVNDSLHLSDTQSVPTGSNPLFDPAIWESPRFAIVPVVPNDPPGNKWIPIVRFVGAFITDEYSGASRSNLVGDSNYHTGLITQTPDKLRAVRTFFFDLDALPDPPEGTALQDYIGAGPKVITLVD